MAVAAVLHAKLAQRQAQIGGSVGTGLFLATAIFVLGFVVLLSRLCLRSRIFWVLCFGRCFTVLALLHSPFFCVLCVAICARYDSDNAVHTHTHARTHVGMPAHMRTCALTAHARAHTNAHMHVHTHAYVCSNMHAYTCAHAHTPAAQARQRRSWCSRMSARPWLCRSAWPTGGAMLLHSKEEASKKKSRDV